MDGNGRDMDVAAEVIEYRIMQPSCRVCRQLVLLRRRRRALRLRLYRHRQPEGFNLDLSFKILFIIIGGVGSISGAFLGSAFIVLVAYFLDVVVQDVFSGILPLPIASNMQLMVFGGLIMFSWIVEPMAWHACGRSPGKLRLWPFPTNMGMPGLAGKDDIQTYYGGDKPCI